MKQEALKGSPDHNSQSPEVSSISVAGNEHDESSSRKEIISDSMKSLTDRLSAALVNVSAKDDLVKQHSKVAEEAVAGNGPIDLILYASSVVPFYYQSMTCGSLGSTPASMSFFFFPLL